LGGKGQSDLAKRWRGGYTLPMGKTDMQQFSGFLTDRGSKYAVSGGPVSSRADVKAFLKTLTRDKRYAKATHNTWAAILPDGGGTKGDDGEAGAGMVILRMLEREGVTGHIIVVTRWFGGTKLGGDRFRRVQDAVQHYLEHATVKGDTC
jgi:putative IMPACT (imprinted ancient) family translation regulator